MNILPKSIQQLLLLVALLAMAGGAMAQENSIRLEHKAEQRQTYVDDDGVEQTRLVEAARVVPGEAILFTVTYTNVGAEPAEDLVITNPVPNAMNYLADSASGDNTDITFSTNGGNNFDSPQNLVVTAADGTQRPAAANDYTHIRWIVRGNIAAGTTGTVQFTALVE